MRTGVSVVICCYNSGKKIIPTLSYLSGQAMLSGVAFEVVIVDNNCTDDTITIARAHWKSLNNPFPLHVIREEQPGLNHARAAGVQHAFNEYIVFCDDDNWLCSDYLINVFQLFQMRKEVALMGGVGIAVFESEPPKWFSRLQGFGYAVGDEGRKAGYVDLVYGAGMAVRRSVFLAVTKRNSLLLTDRRGKSLSSGGDTEICQLVKKAGYQIYLDRNLSFQHYLTADRLSWSYYLKLRRSFGTASAQLLAYNEPGRKLVDGKKAIRQSLSLVNYCCRNWPYLVFPRLLKTARCADFVQQKALRLERLRSGLIHQ